MLMNKEQQFIYSRINTTRSQKLLKKSPFTYLHQRITYVH